MLLRSGFLALLLCLPLAGCEPVGDDDDTVNSTCEGLARGESPEVDITAPDNPSLHDGDDSINWNVLVTDEDSEVTDIDLILVDVSSGVPEDTDIDVPAPDAQGRSVFTTRGDDFAIGQNTLRIDATDDTGCRGDDQILVCVDIDASACTGL